MQDRFDVGGRMHNTTIQLVLQWCCKTNVYFFTRFYRTLSCEKPFKDEYKKFLLIIVLNLIISFLDYAYNYEENFYTGQGGVGGTS